MACTRTYATLRIFSKDMTPCKISNKIGISSNKSRLIEPKSKYQFRRESNYWAFSTKEVLGSVNNIDHLKKLLELLSGKELEMQALRDAGCSTDIFCFWSSNGQGGPSLDVELMSRIVNFGLKITWDVYFDNEEGTDND